LIIIPGNATSETQPEARVNQKFLHDEYKRIAAIIRSCELKPDIAWFGYIPISEEKFAETFGGRLSLYLGQLFEKHRGEAIEIDSCHCNREFELVPKNRYEVFNQCLYATPMRFLATNLEEKERSLEEARNIKWHVANLAPLAASGATPTQSQEDSARFLRQLPNSVLDPYEEEETEECFASWVSEVSYHTLPSLVYELCEHFTLLDIYSFYCQQEIFIGCAPHAKHGKGGKGKSGGTGKGARKGT
jgi:hypothetical protein